MEYAEIPYISLILFLPLVGMFLLIFFPKEEKGLLKGTTLIITLLNFIISLPLYFKFNQLNPDFQFVEKIPWIETYNINYFVGIDGLSLLLVLLTTFLSPIAVVACWKDIQDKVKEFMICLLFLEIGMLGVFASLDLFLFYIFWEVTLIPMYFLIGVWGSPTRRIYAAIKFFIFTMFGSLLMLVGIIYLCVFLPDKITFSIPDLYNIMLPISTQKILFLAFFVAFAIKVPMFPFHTWLPDAHTEAPTVGSVLLAAVLLKMGTYGFVRFNLPLFPQASQFFVPLVCILAIFGIIYGALVCIVQTDLKRLIAFSSVSHLGFVMLGLFALNIHGVSGGMIQMINHGLSTGALFLIVGMLYERRHTRLISDFGGLSKGMPIFAIFFMIVTLSSIGLPGLNGFIGEFLILLGAFKTNYLYGIFAGTGVVFAAVYMLWMFQRVMFGEVTNPKNEKLKDLSIREIGVLLPILFLIVWIGVYPKPFLKKMEPSIVNLLNRVNKQYVEKEKKEEIVLVKKEKGYELKSTSY
jgi:NADH-quinone oxidoreductase subunit M